MIHEGNYQKCSACTVASLSFKITFWSTLICLVQFYCVSTGKRGDNEEMLCRRMSEEVGLEKCTSLQITYIQNKFWMLTYNYKFWITYNIQIIQILNNIWFQMNNKTSVIVWQVKSAFRILENKSVDLSKDIH